MSVRIEIIDYQYSSGTFNPEASIVGELDITDHSEFPLAITFQISDFKDITSTTGDYSKTFKIPATKNNNKLLKHIYNPNIDNAYAVTNKKSCRIIIDDLYALKGLLKVDGVGGFDENPVYYDCVFFGNNLSWASSIEDKTLSEIDWGSAGENLVYKKDDIVATWSDEHCDSSASYIVYPIASYGQMNQGGSIRTIQLFDVANSASSQTYYGFFNNAGSYPQVGNGNSYNTPEPSADWRPAIWVKDTLEKIFKAQGFKMVSNFMDTDMFKKLVWTLPNFKYNNTTQRTFDNSFGLHYTSNVNIGINDTINPTNDEFNPLDYDYFGMDWFYSAPVSSFALDTGSSNTGFVDATSYMTIQEYGYYEINVENFSFWWEKLNYNGGSLDVEYVSIELQIETQGRTGFSAVDSTRTTSFSMTGSTKSGYVTLPKFKHKRYFNTGDRWRLSIVTKARTAAFSGNSLKVYSISSNLATSATTGGQPNARVTMIFDPRYVEYGQTYSLKDVINKELTQLDFIKGIAHSFNLQLQTDEDTKTVTIEPFDSFYLPYSQAIDWTYKVDRSKEVSDKWLENDINREISFKYKSDSNDAVVKWRAERWFNGVEDEYPYFETLPTTFKKGRSTYENPFFAGTFSAKNRNTIDDPSLDTGESPCLWIETGYSSNDAGRPDKGYDFTPRLLSWLKNSPTSSLGVKRASVQTFTNSQIKQLINKASVTSALPAFVSGILPQANMYNRDYISEPNLAYGNMYYYDYNDATNIYAAGTIQKGLFDTYYHNMFEMLKDKPRIRTIYIDLKVDDISNLDFRKLYYIDGSYWRLNRVVDYSVNKNQSTKVEIIEFLQIGAFAGTNPAFGSSLQSRTNNFWDESGGRYPDEHNPTL